MCGHLGLRLQEACASLAEQVLGSDLVPLVFASAWPEEGDEGWRLQIGFEGFSQTVVAQLARAEALLDQGVFKSVRVEDYDVLSGPFGGLYERIAACAFGLRAGTPPDRASSAAVILRRQTRVEAMLVDFGCGRIQAGSNDLSDEILARDGGAGGSLTWEGMSFWNRRRSNSKRATMFLVRRGRNGRSCIK